MQIDENEQVSKMCVKRHFKLITGVCILKPQLIYPTKLNIHL